MPGGGFAERLKELRAAAGLSQAGLARRAGVPAATVRDYEQGRREPGWAAAVALADGLGVRLDDFRPAAKGKGK